MNGELEAAADSVQQLFRACLTARWFSRSGEGLTRRARRERQATDGGRWKRMFCCDVTRRSKGGGASAVGGGEEVRDGRCLMFNVGF